MENKKKVFAIVLFLLLGLITFTFANPSENEKLDDNGNGKTTEKSSSKDKNTTKDNTTTTDNNATNDNTNGTNNDGTNTVANTGNNAVVNNNNNGNNANGNNTTGGNNNNGTNDNNTTNDNNNTNPADDNSNNDEQAKIEEANKKAEEAVEKAEETYDEKDVKNAEDLVSNLTDEDKKEELEERLDDVKEAIAVIALVDELEEKTTSATNKEELDAARNFREESEVEDKVDALKDEELKEELKERLEELAKILDDTTPATIEGIEDGAVTNEDVTLTATDENEVTATLYKDGEEVEYTLGETITEEGNYKLVVVDAAFNESEVSFTIDKTAPKYVNLGILNKDNYPNKGSLEYAKTGNNVRVLVSFKEKLSVEPTVTINGKEFKATFRPQSSSDTMFFYMVDHKITEEDNFVEGELQIKVYGYADKAGNVGEELTNSNITYKKYPRVIYDKTAPKVNFGNGNITDQAFTIEVTDDNFDYMTIWTNKTGKTVTVEGNTYTLPEAAEDNVRYKVTAYDKAGNFTPVEGKDQSIYHDNVKPVVTINGEDVKEESYTSAKVNVSDGSLKKVVITKGEETLKDESFANNYTIKKVTYETEITEDGVYTVTATDRKGNTTTVTFTVETEETKALKAAEAAVATAEETKNQGDVDTAKELVDKLPDGDKKDELEERLEKVQEEINAEAKAKALAEATAAVEKAERTFKEEDYNTAKTLVDALDDSEAKTALENRLKDVKDVIEAEKAVVVAENLRTQEAVDAARDLVNELKESDKKTELTNRLDAIQTELDEQTAAQQKLQDAIDALKAKILEARTYLTNGNVYTDDSKAALERAIANAQSIVDAYGRGETVSLEQISNASDAIDEAIEGLVVKEGTIEKNDVKISFQRTQWLTTNYNITVEGDVKDVKIAEGYYTSDRDYPQDATVVATSAGTFAHHGRWLQVYTVRVEKNDGEVVFARYYALAIF